METPGEILDKISILDIRADKHPDVDVVYELREEIHDLDGQLDNLFEMARKGNLEPPVLARKRHKLRKTKAHVFEGNLDSLTEQLSEVNKEMWENEDLRDRLMSQAKPCMGLLLADRREQQLNQDRNALIGSINEEVVRMIQEGSCVLA